MAGTNPIQRRVGVRATPWLKRAQGSGRLQLLHCPAIHGLQSAVLSLAISVFGLSVATAGERFVVFADLQDPSPEGRERDLELVARINEIKPAFSVFLGDIKGGGSDCSDQLYNRMRLIFDQHQHPLVFTPGDNEWTDCWRPEAGGYDTNERKAAVVERFTASGKSLGRLTMPLQQQRGQRENARWRWQGIVFATLHVTGSNNNLQQRQDAITEHLARDSRNNLWLAETFAEAGDARAVVLLFHANPKWEAQWWEPTGFDRFRASLTRHARQFGRPVLVAHGDTHTFRIDKPLPAVPNLTRVEVFGPPQRGAVVVEVDPDAPEQLQFAPLLLDG